MSGVGGGTNAMIAVLPGDGVGPEVTAAARTVLEAIASRFGHALTFRDALIGGAAIDATGDPLPNDTVALCREADAVLLGAVGGPRWDSPTAKVRPEQGLLGIRRALGLFANLRPVVPYPSLAAISPFRPEHLTGVDMLVVRELTGGIYFGDKHVEASPTGEIASDVCTYTTGEVERIVRVAAELARTRKRHLTSVDKANVLETSRLWRRTVTRVMAEEFPDVQVEHMLVDTCAMRLVQRPSEFDVIVTENMFGDILTDEAAVLAGSIGLLPSASLGGAVVDGAGRVGLYEPIHGSAPDIAGRGIANPIGAILSAAQLLRYSIGLEEEARIVERAVRLTVEAGILTRDVAGDAAHGATTRAVTEQVISHVVAAGSAPRRQFVEPDRASARP
jgi:3-isopropylmalate dehydrogenase